MDAIEKLYLILRTLKMNESDNEEIFYEVLTNFIRKLTYLFFIIIDENISTNIPLNKMYYFLKVQNWHFYMKPCTLHLYSCMITPHIMINNQTFLRQTITETWDIVMDIKIILHRMYWLLGFRKILGECFFLTLH